ncbi:MAG: Uroporphyrinogen-III C-methyltransferase [Candidatus Bathyarchaeota archaeon BA1]|nr:MAG: Uroporphyrinogen-III C-methyltransferase [Candidatus Bathyarchaeota archaeon BA1]
MPGISSALAIPAYAGIPVTHREYASSVAIVTGHEDPTKHENRVRWSKIATSIDTIIILMGVERLESIVKSLVNGGRDPKTDVAIIEWGTTKRQSTITGTLHDIVKKAKEKRVRSPAVIVIGDVVKLQKDLSWFEGDSLVA